MSATPLVVPVAPGAGVLAITTSDDVKRFLPAGHKTAVSPVLDALIEALTEMAMAWQDAGSIAAAQSNVPTATDQFLDGLGEDRSVHRVEHEENDHYQARMLAVPGSVDAASILETARLVLSTVTTTEPQLFDSILDRMYLGGPTTTFHSFLGMGPRYPDRLYPDDAGINGGLFRAGSDPGGAYVFLDQVGRYFLLRVPDISAIDRAPAFLSSGPDAPAPCRSFLGDGTQSVAALFLSTNTQTALAVFQAIVDKVDAIVGHGVRWSLVVDPKL